MGAWKKNNNKSKTLILFIRQKADKEEDKGVAVEEQGSGDLDHAESLEWAVEKVTKGGKGGVARYILQKVQYKKGDSNKEEIILIVYRGKKKMVYAMTSGMVKDGIGGCQVKKDFDKPGDDDVD